MAINVLHLIEGVTSGGASRNTLAMANYSVRLQGVQHRVVSLAPASNKGRLLARSYGVSLVDYLDHSVLIDEIEKADIVQLSYWNCPRVSNILNLRLPPIRLAIWFRIFGAHPPQIITSALINLADVAIMTSPGSLNLPVCQDLSEDTHTHSIEVVHGPADFDRVSGIKPRQWKQGDNFNVGYIGTVDFVKMHPNFITMSCLVNLPYVRFIIYGTGAIDDSTKDRLQQQARELGKVQLFEFRGHVDDIKSAISEFDVFGYPLCYETFATSEAVLQEVMYAGISAVVFPFGGLKNLVKDYETGIVVHDEQEYAAAIKYLFEHPEERKRMGDNARNHATNSFGANNAAVKMNRIYASMMGLAKQQRKSVLEITNQRGAVRQSQLVESGTIQPVSGADLFVASLGSYGAPFLTSLYSINESEAVAADEEIACWAKSYLMTSMGYGSVFNYRNYYPNDGYLHLWCGLMLLRLQKYNAAADEFKAAVGFGCPAHRVHPYLALAQKGVAS